MDDDIAQSIREKIDDAIDVIENLAAEKLKQIPGLLRPAIEMSVNGAFSTVRAILSIPDDIGGDED